MSEEEDFLRRCEIAQRMKALPETERDAAIQAAPNVIDARPCINHRIRQRLLAEQYRRAFHRGGPA